MSTINNDTQMREAVNGMSVTEQRQVAALFVKNVASLSKDARIERTIETAANPAASEEELSNAFKAAKAAALEAHTRCGSDGEWNDQAGYFVARAAEAAVAPQVRSHGKGPAWQAAMSSRMARTCLAADSDEDAHDSESHAQYQILNDHLNS